MQAIAGKLLGYNRQQVDEHLEKIRAAQEAEILLIKENIEACKLERDLLARELEALREERERYVKSGQLLKYALERIESAVLLINKASEDDIKKINAELTRKITVHGNYVADLDKEINQTRAKMDAMLRSILQFSREKDGPAEEDSAARKVVGTIFSPASKSEIVSAMGEDIIGKSVVGSNGALVGRVDSLFIDHQTREIKGFYLKGGRFVPADCVMAVKKDSLVVSADWQKASAQPVEKLETIKALIEKHFTGDVSAGPAENPAGTSGQVEAGKEDLTPGEGLETLKVVEDGPGGLGGGFWDDGFDSDLPNAQPPAEKGETPGSPVAPREDAGRELLFSQSETASAAEPPALAHESRGVTSAPGAGGTAAVNDQAGPGQESANRASPAVAREIKTVRHKYVVGKLAGEDLLAGDGRLIIGKNEVITPEIIDRAEKEGKLAELIVNMVIPGLEQ